jgi:drug/metabolite transporter (DMT)-like permease
MENMRGIVLMILAMAGFAIEDVMVKTVAKQVPLGQVLIVMGLVGTTFFATLARMKNRPIWDRILLNPSVMGRNICEMAGTMGFVLSITLLPLSTASSIFQATPLAMTMGAALFLGESVGWRRWSAIAVGFVGVLLIIRPGMDAFDPRSLWAILAVIALTGRDLFSRTVPKSIADVQLSTYGFATLLPMGGILLYFSDGLTQPNSTQWMLILGACLFSIGAYYALTAASRLGEVSVITPFRYSRLIFAMIFGYTIFNERPDALTLAGAALIIGSGLYTFLRERALGKKQNLMDADTTV